MKTRDLQDLLQSVLDELITTSDDDESELADLARQAEDIAAVRTFRDVGVLTRNAGIVIVCEDGSEFQLTIVRSQAGGEV